HVFGRNETQISCKIALRTLKIMIEPLMIAKSKDLSKSRVVSDKIMVEVFESLNKFYRFEVPNSTAIFRMMGGRNTIGILPFLK
ncbi:MAG: hypothetical protein MHPSP_004152, partial [Paramarteilia canceri]